MKKLTALFLALMLLLGAVGASAELDPMTDEEITLTFGTWMNDENWTPIMNASIEAFEAAYPNITVELIPMSTGTLFEDLQNMAAAGTLPDMFLTINVPTVVTNGWALDVDKYLENDPDAAAIMPSMIDAARIDGRAFAIPAYLYPYICIVNKTNIEEYNLEMPSADWTLEEYHELAEGMAHYENWDVGAGGHQLQRWYPALMEGKSLYCWDGEKYDFTETWVESIEIMRDMADMHAWEGWESEEDKIAALGSTSVWIGGTGLVGLFMDYNWGVKPFLTFYNKKTAHDFYIYPQPLGETDNAMCAADYLCICAATEYPRETYELSKWLVWGEQACNDAIAHHTAKKSKTIDNLPVITTEYIWEAYANTVSDHVLIYDSQRNYIPEASYVAPGYTELDAWIAENNIWGGIWSHQLDGYAVLDELNEVAQGFVDDYYDNLILD
ncbi:MAG: extracellular solute-binding protein [Clostridiales bacterium]|nr:extracellular solute-binding protein [Clostridiales bacterium]